MAELKCSNCKKMKPTSEFYKSKRESRGFQYYCIECSKNRDSVRTDRGGQVVKRQQDNYQLVKKYGITTEQRDQMIIDQDGKCAICPKMFEQTPDVDHCHFSNKLRGLLCQKCNKGLGMFDDDPKLLRAAADYLERFII